MAARDHPRAARSAARSRSSSLRCSCCGFRLYSSARGPRPSSIRNPGPDPRSPRSATPTGMGTRTSPWVRSCGIACGSSRARRGWCSGGCKVHATSASRSRRSRMWTATAGATSSSAPRAPAKCASSARATDTSSRASRARRRGCSATPSRRRGISTTTAFPRSRSETRVGPPPAGRDPGRSVCGRSTAASTSSCVAPRIGAASGRVSFRSWGTTSRSSITATPPVR